MKKRSLLAVIIMSTLPAHAVNSQYQDMLATRARILNLSQPSPSQPQEPETVPALQTQTIQINSDLDTLLQQLKDLSA